MAPESLNCVVGATGRIAARGRQERRHADLIAAHEYYEELCEHSCVASSPISALSRPYSKP